MSQAARLSDEGYALLEAGRLHEALDVLLRALALSPDDPIVHYRLGLVYGDLGRPQEALAAYDSAIALRPDHARAHNNRGSALQLLERADEAEAAFRRALATDPLLPQPYINLGHLLESRDVAAAIALYQKAIAHGQDAGLFEHHIAALRGRTTPRADPSWVRATFDNFAPGFDRQLAALEYSVPEVLAGMLPDGASGLEIADLGCGTGLVGLVLAGRGHRITGIDLSEKMLNLASERGVYSSLENVEIDTWLAGRADASFDMVVAADVFIYIGALESTLAGIARVLRKNGRLAFSIEECEIDYELRKSGRYAQSDAYIQRCTRQWFTSDQEKRIVIRQESGQPLTGKVYVMRRNSVA